MKKIYQEPNTQVVLVQTTQVIAASLGVFDTTITKDEMLSREDNAFTFEDDEFTFEDDTFSFEE